jgi:amidase
MSSSSDLIARTACDIVDDLKRGEITPLDLLDALEARIAEVDPKVNALPTLSFDRARDHARKLMAKPVAERGILAGMPIPIKDLVEVEGVRTTWGSPIHANHIPTRSAWQVQNLEKEGAIVYAKSATPEFGAGANTFNEVFGATLNPWNRTRSAAGSSGGAGVALATGMAWVAQGSDTGGSLRNPASFCGVVGLRPSRGRVARDPGVLADSLLGVDGPMARNIADTGLLLDAMCGENPADPLSLPRMPYSYRDHASRPKKPRRVAFSADLGITPVDPEVAAICRAAADRLAADGVIVEEAHPDLSEAHNCFQVLRAFAFAAGFGERLRKHPGQMKPEMVWNVEKGLNQPMADVFEAYAQRTELIKRTVAFFDTYDLLLTPATIVAPFPVEERYVESCAGHKFETYIDWLAIAYGITLTTAPALSMPCGFTKEKLPVGLQVVAMPRAEHDLLAGAAYIEALLGPIAGTPIDPR